MADLDSILSGNSSAAPEAEKVEEVTQAEGESQQQTDAEADVEDGDEDGQRTVPHAALHAAKQKAKRYTEQVAVFEGKVSSLEQTLKDRESMWERRFSEMLEKLGPKEAPQPQPDWFENPDAALSARLGQSINPIATQLSNLQTQILRLTAAQTYGAEKVQAFEAFVEEAMKRGDPEMATLGAQMRASADPMKTGLDWFEKRTFDPAKERERLRAEVLAELQKEQEEQPQRVAPVLPSNLAGARNVGARSGPVWSGPASLQDILGRK